jgi:hypothetical protein
LAGNDIPCAVITEVFRKEVLISRNYIRNKGITKKQEVGEEGGGFNECIRRGV